MESSPCRVTDINRDALYTICCSGLTRLLDIEDLDEFLQCESDQGNQTRNLSKNLTAILKKKSFQFFNLSHAHHSEKSNKKGKKVFGSPIAEETLDSIIPLLKFLHENADREGIFRVSGNKRRIAQLKELIDNDNINISKELASGEYTPFDVGDLLKNFFSELPVSFLPENHYSIYYKTAELQNDGKRLEALQLLLLLLSPESREILHQLLGLLHKISRLRASKMTAYNLAVVFTPNMIHFGKDLATEANDIELLMSIVTFMIENFQNVLKIRPIDKVTFLQIPCDISVQIEKYMKKIENSEEDDALAEIAIPSSAKKSTNYEEETNQHTAAALSQLLDQIKQIPDEAQRNAMLKKFDKYHVGTPPMSAKRSLAKVNATPNSAYRPMHATPIATPQLHRKLFKTPQSAVVNGLDPVNSITKSAFGVSTPVIKTVGRDTNLETPKMSKVRQLRQGSFHLPKRIKLNKEKENCGVPV
ncbi:Rho GTPase-activating protein 19 [Trichoplax sp. H2]|nr:Rho GTPase-activating protein 19 [Trichoplax sp. H2]|eukprot:RDD37401.1 Rho GTPase-activating protein 19 [Trichoplax sp. H2]